MHGCLVRLLNSRQLWRSHPLQTEQGAASTWGGSGGLSPGCSTGDLLVFCWRRNWLWWAINDCSRWSLNWSLFFLVIVCLSVGGTLPVFANDCSRWSLIWSLVFLVIMCLSVGGTLPVFVEVSNVSRVIATCPSGSAAPPSSSTLDVGAFDEGGAWMPYSGVESLQTWQKSSTALMKVSTLVSSCTSMGDMAAICMQACS